MRQTVLLSQKKNVLRVFNTLKYPSPSARFELAKLGSNEKHANYYTTQDYHILPLTI
jgi:hypothetical protein